MKKILIISISIFILIASGYYFWNVKNAEKEKMDAEEQKKWAEEYLKKADQRKKSEQERIEKEEKQRELDEAEELTLSGDELKQYYAVYKDPFVLHIRKVMDGYLAGKEMPDLTIDKNDLDGAPSGLAAFDKEYYQSKFAVLAIDDALYGGKDVLIIFQDKPDKIFTAWVYKLADGEYDFRGFWENDEATKKIDLALKVFGKYIFDREHSL